MSLDNKLQSLEQVSKWKQTRDLKRKAQTQVNEVRLQRGYYLS